jgi:hypothetical protein
MIILYRIIYYVKEQGHQIFQYKIHSLSLEHHLQLLCIFHYYLKNNYN